MTVGFRVLRDNGLRLDPSFTLAVKAMVQAEVIATTLRPPCGRRAAFSPAGTRSPSGC